MTGAGPQLTVWIPTYNRAGFLRDCLSALLDQGLARDEWTVVVSDNASTDATPDVVREFSDRLPLQHLRREKNIPAIDNLNAAGEAARTPFLSVLCDDDLVPPGQLGRGLRTLRAHDDGVVYGALGLGVHRPGDPTAFPLGMLLDVAPVAGEPFLYRWSPRAWLANCSLHTPLTIIGSIFRLDRIPVRPLFDPAFPQEADRKLFIALTAHGAVYSSPWIGGYLRYHPGQQTRENLHDTRRDDVTRFAFETAKALGHDLAAHWREALPTLGEAELEWVGPRLARRWPDGLGEALLREAKVEERLAALRRDRRAEKARRKGGLIGRLRGMLGG